MKAVYIERVGPPENIRYGELPTPAVGERDVLVQVAAVTVDPIDTYIRSGAYPIDLPSPFIIGRDMTGVVVQAGAGVTQFRPGDRVWANNQGYGSRQGTFAEFVAIDEGLLYPLPEGVDAIEAVAVLHSALTAVAGLSRVKLRGGETLFINGGDGNVGTAVLQLAKVLGVRVAVTSANDAKAEWCRELGVDRVIDYKTENVEGALRRFAPGGIDVYWDTTGKPDVESALKVLARRRRIVLMSGLTHQCTLPVGPFYTHNCTMFGFTVTDATREEIAAYAREINARLVTGALRAKVNRVLPLSQAAEAHRLVEQGKLFGKIVLVP